MPKRGSGGGRSESGGRRSRARLDDGGRGRTGGRRGRREQGRASDRSRRASVEVDQGRQSTWPGEDENGRRRNEAGKGQSGREEEARHGIDGTSPAPAHSSADGVSLKR